ncbi:MAG: hypothetical protein QME25_09120, partial [Bacteroidota bacterium]|nr:hypothetical protein [Bacteroidota bacterium]
MIEKTISNIDDVHQLIRASGSVGANYIELEQERSNLIQESTELNLEFLNLFRNSTRLPKRSGG